MRNQDHKRKGDDGEKWAAKIEETIDDHSLAILILNLVSLLGFQSCMQECKGHPS